MNHNRITILFLILLFTQAKSGAKTWTLSDKNLEISFNDETALLSVTDKRCNKIWQQTCCNRKYEGG